MVKSVPPDYTDTDHLRFNAKPMTPEVSNAELLSPWLIGMSTFPLLGVLNQETVIFNTAQQTPTRTA